MVCSFVSLIVPIDDPPRLALVVERRVESKKRAKSGRAGVKKQELESKLGVDKAKVLMARLREKGLWQYDEDWPNDDEDDIN